MVKLPILCWALAFATDLANLFFESLSYLNWLNIIILLFSSSLTEIWEKTSLCGSKWKAEMESSILKYDEATDWMVADSDPSVILHPGTPELV